MYNCEALNRARGYGLKLLINMIGLRFTYVKLEDVSMMTKKR